MKDMTPEEFHRRFGFEPIDDDIIRTTCPDAGQPGHHSCGICRKHKQPRFTCGCALFSRKEKEVKSLKHLTKKG